MSLGFALLNTCLRLPRLIAISTSFSTWYSVKLLESSLKTTSSMALGVTLKRASFTRSEMMVTDSLRNLGSASVNFMATPIFGLWRCLYIFCAFGVVPGKLVPHSVPKGHKGFKQGCLPGCHGRGQPRAVRQPHTG